MAPAPSLTTRLLTRKVVGFLGEYRLTDRLAVVGVSGGPDSVCLLHILASLRPTLPLQLHAAHLDHGLRGREAKRDAAYVADLCERLSVPLTVESADVPALRRRLGLSTEDAARRARHDFFASVAQRIGAPVVLVGHTADDQVETVLLRILRGSGLAGLAGMEPLVIWKDRRPPLRVGRPLLTAWRRETEAYCRLHRLKPRHDSSNRSLRYLRNRVRHELLPYLRRYNPGIAAALLRLGEQAALMSQHLDRETDRAWSRLARWSRTEAGSEALLLDRKALEALSPALQRHAVRRALAEARGGIEGITEAHIRRLAELAAGPAGKVAALPGGLRFLTGYEAHRIVREGAGEEAPAGMEMERPLRVPGVTRIDGWRVDARVVAANTAELKSSGYVAYMDPGVATRPLAVRTRRPGDRFHPLGMQRPKKLQDYFVDAKVPRELRDGVPLVCANGEIVWVVGYRISEAVKVPSGSKSLLRLQFMRAG